MIHSWFGFMVRELTDACGRIKSKNLVVAIKSCIADIYGLPMAQVKKVEDRVAERNAEAEKICEICGGQFKQRIKKSDVMCRHCKLEISLGRQVDDE